MPFLRPLGILPLVMLGLRVIEESLDILIQSGLVLFDNREVKSSIGMHSCTPLPLSMHRVRDFRCALSPMQDEAKLLLR